MKEQKKCLAKARIEMILCELKYSYPDLIYPLSRLQWKECENQQNAALATDGMHIFFKPELILLHQKNYLKHVILHILMHGLLGHFQMKDDYENITCRNIIMDMQVGYLMHRWDMFPTLSRVNEFEELFHGDFSMGQYFQLIKNPKFMTNKNYYKSICEVDPHEIWDVEKNPDQKNQLIVFWKDIQDVVFGKDNSYHETNLNKQNILQQIKCILSDPIKRDAREKNYEILPMDEMQNYREILQKLLLIKETSYEYPDSIDPMFYHYGCELYGNMPLIEPLEISERSSLQTLAIAIDVSGSCISDEIMRRFWYETFCCISQLKEEYTDGEILLLQCDEAIQNEEWIELMNFTEIPANVKIRGMGGTNFIPVFERLAEFKKFGKEFDALIYLTDGKGIYPNQKPEYPVYFVLPEQFKQYEKSNDIPGWIEKVYLKA